MTIFEKSFSRHLDPPRDEVVQKLLKRGADPNALDKQGNSVMHAAARAVTNCGFDSRCKNAINNNKVIQTLLKLVEQEKAKLCQCPADGCKHLRDYIIVKNYENIPNPSTGQRIKHYGHKLSNQISNFFSPNKKSKTKVNWFDLNYFCANSDYFYLWFWFSIILNGYVFHNALHSGTPLPLPLMHVFCFFSCFLFLNNY